MHTGTISYTRFIPSLHIYVIHITYQTRYVVVDHMFCNGAAIDSVLIKSKFLLSERFGPSDIILQQWKKILTLGEVLKALQGKSKKKCCIIVKIDILTTGVDPIIFFHKNKTFPLQAFSGIS